MSKHCFVERKEQYKIHRENRKFEAVEIKTVFFAEIAIVGVIGKEYAMRGVLPMGALFAT